MPYTARIEAFRARIENSDRGVLQYQRQSDNLQTWLW
jgi:hypothetical protein